MCAICVHVMCMCLCVYPMYVSLCPVSLSVCYDQMGIKVSSPIDILWLLQGLRKILFLFFSNSLPADIAHMTHRKQINQIVTGLKY